MKINQRSTGFLGFILVVLIYLAGCTSDDWQDHLTDPGLGGEPADQVDPWIGSWSFVSWWATDGDGIIVEGPEEYDPGSEGGLTLNEDGTFVFTGYGAEAEGTYTVEDNVLTLDIEDSWWGQEWLLSFTEDGNLLMGSGEWPEGEGEGYELAEGEGEQVDPWIGSWNLISWWATDETGEIVEGPEEYDPGSEGGLILNEDGTYVFNGFGDEAEGTYTVENDILTLDIADSWWGQEWNLSFDEEDNMQMGSGEWPTGEGEGYLLARAEE